MTIPSELQKILKTETVLITPALKKYERTRDGIKVTDNADVSYCKKLSGDVKRIYVVDYCRSVYNQAESLYIKAAEDGSYLDIYILKHSTLVRDFKKDASVTLGGGRYLSWYGDECGIRVYRNKRYMFLHYCGKNKIRSSFTSTIQKFDPEEIDQDDNRLEKPSRRKISYSHIFGIPDIRNGVAASCAISNRWKFVYPLNDRTINEIRKVFPENSKYTTDSKGNQYPLVTTNDLLSMLNGSNRNLSNKIYDEYAKLREISDSAYTRANPEDGCCIHRDGDKVFYSFGSGTFKVLTFGKKTKYLEFSNGARCVPSGVWFGHYVRCIGEDIFKGTAVEKVLSDEEMRDVFTKRNSVGELYVDSSVYNMLNPRKSWIFEQFISLGFKNLVYAAACGYIDTVSRKSYPSTLPMCDSTSVVKSSGMNIDQLRELDKTLRLDIESVVVDRIRFHDKEGVIHRINRKFCGCFGTMLEETRRIILVDKKWNTYDKKAFSTLLNCMHNRGYYVSSTLRSIANMRHITGINPTELYRILEYFSGGHGDIFHDYIQMRKQMLWYGEVDEHEFPVYPKKDRILELHNRIVNEYNRRYHISYDPEKDAEAEKKYESVQKLVCAYEYHDDKYSIIAPKKISELSAEGAYLHHCVGSYKNTVARGYEYILFMRRNSCTDVPWITIDITPDGSIRQIHGSRNSNIENMDERDSIMEFLGKWVSEKNLKQETLTSEYGAKCHV